MQYAAQIIGIFGILCFVISNTRKSRGKIIAFAFLARVLFIVQYIFLGAFAGAGQNAVGCAAAVIAANKNKKPFGHIAFYLAVCVLTVLAGILTFSSWLSAFPMAAMLLQNSALWLEKPKVIRIVSLSGIPFWLVYNFATAAYPSVACDIISAASLIYSLIKYDVLLKNNY